MITENLKLTLVTIAFIAGLFISATNNPLIGVAVLFTTVLLIELDPRVLRRIAISRR